jgi:hypothetical protein
MATTRAEPGKKKGRPTAPVAAKPVEPDEDDEFTAFDPEVKAPLADPKGAFDTRFLTGLFKRTLALTLEHLELVLLPVGLLVVFGLADTFISSRAWYLGVPIGALKGAGWGYYLGSVAKLVRGDGDGGRGLTMIIVACVLALTEWSFGWGLTVALVFIFLPMLDFAVAVPKAETFLRQTVLLLRRNGLTWYGSQAALLVAAGLVMLTVYSLGTVVLGPVFGGLLTAVIFAPIAHLWVVSRAIWCHRWI